MNAGGVLCWVHCKIIYRLLERRDGGFGNFQCDCQISLHFALVLRRRCLRRELFFSLEPQFDMFLQQYVSKWVPRTPSRSLNSVPSMGYYGVQNFLQRLDLRRFVFHSTIAPEYSMALGGRDASGESRERITYLFYLKERVKIIFCTKLPKTAGNSLHWLDTGECKIFVVRRICMPPRYSHPCSTTSNLCLIFGRPQCRGNVQICLRNGWIDT